MSSKFLLLCSLLAYLAWQSASESFFIRDGQMVDDSGRERFFHGVNVVYKSPPYAPITDHFDADLSFSEEDMQFLQELGMNVIRLGVMWPGVEPEQGVYNDSYIQLMLDVIENSYEYGIYTLVDAHQDVLSEKYCGEGIPLWAAESYGRLSFPLPLQREPYEVDNETGIPVEGECDKHSWSNYYFTQAASTAFQNLYENTDGLSTYFGASWAELASAYKGVDGVIGFELLNEPWAGDIFSEPKLLYPGVADKENLAPFYEVLASAIREVDDDRIVFFESVTWTDEFGNTKLFDMGFDQVPGGTQYENRSAFAYHFYNPPNLGDMEDYFIARVSDADKLGCVGFVTEFNLGSYDSTSSTMDVMDKYLQSWIAWEYKPLAGSLPDGTCTGCGYGLFNSDGSKNEDSMKAVSRGYAQAVAGSTKSMFFNDTTVEFTLTFEIDTSISEPTQVYISEDLWYTNGYSVSVEPEGYLDWTSPTANTIQFLPTDSTVTGTEITITVSQS